MSYKQDITKDFISRLEQLIKDRIVKDYTEIITPLKWNKSALSNVVNGRRNIPVEKYQLFNEVYKMETKEPETDRTEKLIQVLEKQVNDKEETINILLKDVKEDLRLLITNSTALIQGQTLVMKLQQGFADKFDVRILHEQPEEFPAAVGSKTSVHAKATEEKGKSLEAGKRRKVTSENAK